MTLRPLTWIEIGAASLVVIVGGIWLHEHDARIREQAVAQAVQDTQKQIRAEDDKKFSELAAKIDAREAAYTAQSKLLSQRFQAAATPQETAQLVASLMGLKTPITITTPMPTAANPTPQPVAQISSLDFPQAKSYIQDCESCKLEVPKLRADVADRDAQAALSQRTIDSLKVENKALVVANKGGTVWHRTVKAMKYIVFGAAGGVVAICGTGHCR